MRQGPDRRIGKKNGRAVRLSDHEHATLRVLPTKPTSVRKQTRDALMSKGFAAIVGGQMIITDEGRALATRPNLSDPAIEVLSRLPLPYREWKKQANYAIQGQLVRKGLVEDDGFGCVILTDKAKADDLLARFLKEKAA